MKRNFIRLFLIAAAVMLLVVGVVSAHERRTVGTYQIAFGWRNEPAYIGEFTGPEIFISMAPSSTPEATDQGMAMSTEPASNDLANLDINLKAEVSIGDQTTTVTFKPAYGEVGHYIADLIPTVPGDYTFHVTGNIGDTQVDETFTSAAGKFSTVNPASDIEFPSAQSLEARVATLEQQVSQIPDLEQQITQLQATVQQLQNK